MVEDFAGEIYKNMVSKETRIIESVKADNKATIDKISEMLVSFRTNPPDMASPLHQDLKNQIQSLTKLMEGHIVKHEKDTQEMKDKIEPVLNAINTAGSLKKALLGFAAVVLAIAGSIAGIKSIMGYFK